MQPKKKVEKERQHGNDKHCNRAGVTDLGSMGWEGSPQKCEF